MARRTLLSLLVIVVLSAGCFARSEEDPNAEPHIPDSPPDTIGGVGTGPVEVLATGLTEEIGWRFSVYPSAEGQCLQFEYNTGNDGGGSAGCGVLDEGEPNETITWVGAGSTPTGAGYVDGSVRSDVAELRLLTDGGPTLTARIIDLDDLGLGGQAFLVLVPPEIEPSTLVALDADGNELGTANVSEAFGPPRDQAPAQPPDTTNSDS